MSSIFTTLAGVPVILEFTGDDPPADAKTVTTAIEYAVERSFTFEIPIGDDGTASAYLLVNFAGITHFFTSDIDPREDGGDEPTIYPIKVVDFLQLALTQSATRRAEDAT